jgi:hypothetical protein
MQTVTVDLGPRRYPIHIGSGLLAASSLWTPHLGKGQIMLVTNTVLAPLYLAPVLAALGDRRADSLILPDGEAAKTLATAERIWDALLAARCGRDATLIALGGGVIGDLTGFAAACYQRGIDFIQIPTTLLAQVDSSVGRQDRCQPSARQEHDRRFPPAALCDCGSGHLAHLARAGIAGRAGGSDQIRFDRRCALFRLAGNEPGCLAGA